MPKSVITFKDQLQVWTKEEIERFAYLKFKKGLDTNSLYSHFKGKRKHFAALEDYILENKKYMKWVK